MPTSRPSSLASRAAISTESSLPTCVRQGPGGAGALGQGGGHGAAGKPANHHMWVDCKPAVALAATSSRTGRAAAVGMHAHRHHFVKDPGVEHARHEAGADALHGTWTGGRHALGVVGG